MLEAHGWHARSSLVAWLGRAYAGAVLKLAVLKIAVLGTGAMGAAIAQRLLGAGHEVTVWNRTASRTGPLVAAGARAAASPAEAVADAEVVVLMLADGAAVADVLAAAAPAVRPGTSLIQMSTIAPAAARALPARLPDGVAVVEAPVAGSVDAAGAGRLTVLAGGDDAALAAVEGVLATLGTVRRCGPLGSAAALKLVLNAGMITAVAALADALAVARTHGVPTETALAALSAGPLSGVAARAASTTAAFAIAMAAKDLRLALDGVPAAPVARGALTKLSIVDNKDADIAALVTEETM